MEDQSSLVRVNIFGQEYKVKAPADTSYIIEVAEYVDTKMREVAEGLNSQQPSSRIAILAAMNISDELIKIKENRTESNSTVENRISSLIDYIDDNAH